MSDRKEITIEKIYEIVVDLQRDLAFIKKNIIDEPDLRDEFIMRMRDIDLEDAVQVKDFSERYGLK